MSWFLTKGLTALLPQEVHTAGLLPVSLTAQVSTLPKAVPSRDDVALLASESSPAPGRQLQKQSCQNNLWDQLPSCVMHVAASPGCYWGEPTTSHTAIVSNSSVHVFLQSLTIKGGTMRIWFKTQYLMLLHSCQFFDLRSRTGETWSQNLCFRRGLAILT